MTGVFLFQNTLIYNFEKLLLFTRKDWNSLIEAPKKVLVVFIPCQND